MKVDKGDFTQGSVISNMFRISIPIILAELVHVTYNIVDRIYIGHIPGCGTEALTGIGLVLPFITIITAFSNLCSYGAGTLAAIERGKKNDEEARKIMENAFTLLVISGLVLMVLFFLFTEKLVMVFGGDEITTVYACEYFDTYMLGTVFVMISLGMNCFINMQGYSVIGMFTVVIGAVLNIILDPIFIFALNMGIKGAAVATVISQFFSALWVVLFLRKKTIPIRLSCFRVDRKITSETLRLGVGGFLFKATNSATQAVVNSTLRIFGGVSGTLFIASMSVINSLREIVCQPVFGFVEGSKSVLSYNYGAKEYERVNMVMMWMHLVTFAFTIIVWLALMLFPESLIRFFTSDENLIATCIPCLRAYYCLFIFMCLQTCGQNIFVALKHPGYSVFFSLFRKIALLIPLTVILPRIGLGVMGVFWAESISEVIGASACHITMCLKVWNPIKKLCRKSPEKG